MNRTCDDSALLVGGEHRLPTDPCEYNYEYRNGAGCNNLRCVACGVPVRSGAPGLRLAGGRTPKDLPAMYETKDWTALPFIKAEHPGWRLYACKCACWEEASEHLVVNDGDSPGDARLPWACDGHPAPELPTTLGQLVIAEHGTDWNDIVYRVLRGTSPRKLERSDEGPARWLIWLRMYLQGLPVTAGLSKAVVDQIHDSNVNVVGTVLAYLRWFRDDPGCLEAAVARAEENLESVLVGYKLPESNYAPRLWDVLLAAMRRPSDELRARVIEVMRKVMLQPASEDDAVKETLANWAYADLYRESDLQWMAENIAAIDAAGPGRWIHVMELLLHAQREEAGLGHLVAIGGIALIQSRRVPVTEFRSWMARHGDDKDAWTWPLEAALNG